MNIFGVLVYCLAYLCLVIGYAKSMDEGIADTQKKQIYSLSTIQNYEEMRDHDLHQFIEKLRQKKWVIENDTDRCVELVLKASYTDRNYGKEATEMAPLWMLTLGAHENFTAGSKLAGDEGRKVIYEDIKFNHKNSGPNDESLFLNLKKSGDNYKIHIQTIYTTVFPQIVDFFDFTPHPLYDSTQDAPVIVSSPQQNGQQTALSAAISLPPVISDTSESEFIGSSIGSPQEDGNTNVGSSDDDLKQVYLGTSPYVDVEPNQIYLPMTSAAHNQQGTNQPSSLQIGALMPGMPVLSLAPSNLELGFIKQYNSHLNYLFNVQFSQEKIDKDAYFSKLNGMYQRNCLDKMLHSQGHGKVISTTKIPAIIHTLWLTSDDDPKEFPKRYLYWLEKSIEACPASQVFKHWFWVHDKSKLPNTMEALFKMNVTVRETNELGDFPLKEWYDLEMKNRKYGRSSDIFRMVVLNQFGGIYKDSDYRIHQSMLPLLQSYHFIAGREPMSSFVCNALIGACPGHPVIRRCMDLIARNYDEEKSPRYIKNIKDADGFKTILLTGPGVMVTAIAQAIDQQGYTDIVLPHPYLYPTPVDAYPQKWPSKPNQAVPAAAYGVHYWETSWAKARSKEFGSFG